ncbi:MAG TPA: hypothetical protein VF861_14555 [Telluria sp.]
MKSVTMSEVVRASERTHHAFPTHSWREIATLALGLGSGLVAIMYAVHLLAPESPLAYIVIPALVGGLLPVFATAPGRFEVCTRFDAQHLAGSFDLALEALGFTQAGTDGATIRYRNRALGWLCAHRQEVSVTLRERRVEIVGPMSTLRRLQRHMTA